MGALSFAARAIRGSGTLEADWQAWPGLNELPAVTAAELVPEGARAVIVAPHPDDEILGSAGLMVALQASQRRLSLIAVTDGSASHPGSTTWPPERLARQRPLETEAALATLGLNGLPVQRLGLQDGAVSAHEPDLARLLIARIRPTDVVFTTWRLDGHPDHEACGRTAALACAEVGARLVELPIWAWHWAAPGDARLPWSRACRLPLPAHTVDAKREAAQAFISQTTHDPESREGCVLPPATLARLLRPMEVFFR